MGMLQFNHAQKGWKRMVVRRLLKQDASASDEPLVFLCLQPKHGQSLSTRTLQILALIWKIYSAK